MSGSLITVHALTGLVGTRVWQRYTWRDHEKDEEGYEEGEMDPIYSDALAAGALCFVQGERLTDPDNWASILCSWREQSNQ